MLVTAFNQFFIKISCIGLSCLICFLGSTFLSRMAPEVLQPGTGYNFKYVNLCIFFNLFSSTHAWMDHRDPTSFLH